MLEMILFALSLQAFFGVNFYSSMYMKMIPDL